MAKKVLIITGSPKPEGNSNTLVTAFVAGATAAGNEVEIFNAATANMDGCHGDASCFERGTCALKDDGVKLHALMGWADVLVLASPVYFKGFTSQIKKVIDRFYPYAAPKPRAACTVKESFLIATAGNPDPAIFSAMKEEFDLINKILKFEKIGDLCIGGLKGPDDAGENADALAKAVEAGYQI